ncbi:hypothetical protein [Nocardioides sp. AE5]|uniref:hypothetical protein n=1 Tax=Nocardioides sp. AE5 TaxID=2962573 RepID=UPI002882B10E|nr:hypothetical protein [Nocardioides sp. AE5]MDT0202459.1 hypothetical protein [Nocardioides sp. AE5]
MTEGIIDATADQVMEVVKQMVDLPRPDGDEWLEWEIDGLEGQTNYLMHVLPLAATADASGLSTWTAAIAELADRRWGARTHFDATRFTDDKETDPASYDRRSAPASMVRALDADDAVWWPFGHDAVMLVDNSAAERSTSKAAVFVLPRQWLSAEAQGASRPGEARPADDGSLRADFLSKDSSRVLHAVWEVFKTRDPQVLEPLVRSLPAIERATEELDLGGALISNGSNLDHAFHRIRLFGEKKCLCAAYAHHVRYEPAKEEALGHVRITAETPVFFNGRPDRPKRMCECTDCGRRFEVEEGEYHYTWWKWNGVRNA